MGIKPTTGFKLESSNVMVTVDAAMPFAKTEVVPVIVEFALIALPAKKTRLFEEAETEGVKIDIVLVPATVEVKVQAEIPLVLVAEQVPIVLPLPVAEKVGVTPLTGRRLASVKVIETIEEEVPLAIVGPVPEIVPLAALGSVNKTSPPAKLMGVNKDKVFSSAWVDLRLQIATPTVFVVEQSP